MVGSPSRPHSNDPFIENRTAIAKANAYLLKRVTLCAFINMTILSIVSPYLSGFTESLKLYVASALLTGLFTLYSFFFLDRQLNAVIPLFYALLAGLCGYAVLLSTYFYPTIHGVTLIGIFMLIPMILLDRTWRVNLILFLYYCISCILTLLRKPLSIAIDDCVTSGAFILFGMLIGNYLRATRLRAIEQQRQLTYQRDMDALTGLPNRRLLFDTLKAQDQSGPDIYISGIIMIDIDHFKDYNDQNGHQAGDECLRALGAFFQQFSTDTGIPLYRYGGEEFLALLRSNLPDEPGDVAQKLVTAVRSHALPGPSVTISAGYVRRTDATLRSEKLIRMADDALYEAKRQGRNRAVGYTGTPAAKA